MKRYVLLFLITTSLWGAPKLLVEVSAGELLDKITILEIKLEHITNPDKRENIERELAAVKETASCIPSCPELDALIAELKKHNQALWRIEDDIRLKEAAQEFDAKFIELARAVYFTNDKRGNVKREINILVGSRLIEEKQYAKYNTDCAVIA